NDSLTTLRKRIVELCINNPQSMRLTGLEALPNLRRLALYHRIFSPGLIATLALHAPRLVSLSFRHSNPTFWKAQNATDTTNGELTERSSTPDLALTLQFRLRSHSETLES